jgi:glutathione S-transferase
MNDIVVYGIPGSPYLRSALLGLHEKRVSYRLAAEFLAGDTLSIADLMLAPQLQFFRGTPEAEALMQGTALDDWLKRMQARPSMQATEAERLKQAA